MQYENGNPDELKEKFWKELDASPFVMLELDGHSGDAAPMTAQLDKEANSAIWFFTSRNGPFAAMGPATATFSAKGHNLFARFDGVLSEEADRARIDRFWSKMIEAWFPQGKGDPNLLLMRMDLGQAKIWDSNLGLMGTARMLLGMDTRAQAQNNTVETRL